MWPSSSARLRPACRWRCCCAASTTTSSARRATRRGSPRSAPSRAPNGASASRSSALETIGETGLRSCADVDPDAVRRVVMSTTPIKQITVVDAGRQSAMPAAGAAARRTALSRELRTADDRVFLGVIRTEQGERALRLVWRRAGDAAASDRPAPRRRVPARRRGEHRGEQSGRAHHAQRRHADRGARRNRGQRQGRRRFDQCRERLDALPADRDRDGVARRGVRGALRPAHGRHDRRRHARAC